MVNILVGAGNYLSYPCSQYVFPYLMDEVLQCSLCTFYRIIYSFWDMISNSKINR